MLPFLGSVLMLLVPLALLTFYLWRQGQLTVSRLGGGSRAPEEEAKRILADRFARGDLSAEELLERASILSWTPGVEPVPARRRTLRG